MQVSTGQVWSDVTMIPSTIPSSDLVMIQGTLEQAEAIGRAVRNQHAADAKRKARRAAQASRRANR